MISSLTFVMHVQKQSLHASPSQKNLKLGWKSLANAFTGIFEDLPLSKALMDTVTWQHKSMTPPGKQNCIFKKRKVSFLSPTKWMRPTLKPKLGKKLRYLTQIEGENFNLHPLSTIRIKEEQYESLWYMTHLHKME